MTEPRDTSCACGLTPDSTEPPTGGWFNCPAGCEVRKQALVNATRREAAERVE